LRGVDELRSSSSARWPSRGRFNTGPLAAADGGSLDSCALVVRTRFMRLGADKSTRRRSGPAPLAAAPCEAELPAALRLRLAVAGCEYRWRVGFHRGLPRKGSPGRSTRPLELE